MPFNNQLIINKAKYEIPPFNDKSRSIKQVLKAFA